MDRPFSVLTPEDLSRACGILGELRPADLVIAPDGEPYIYRWYVTPRSRDGNVYFHIQVKDDPDRPLHTHPWESTSVILSGGYAETIQIHPPYGETVIYRRPKGAVVHRSAEAAHRLTLLDGAPYTMTLFSTGPNVNKWGFWHGTRFIPYAEVVREDGGKSTLSEDTPWLMTQ